MILATIAATILSLNDTYFAGQSGAPSQFQESTQIQMLTADIRIQVPSGKVKTTYKFKNHGPATSVRMGFPEEGQDAYLDESTKTHFQYFRSSLDGKSIKTTPIKRTDSQDYEDFGYKIWWTKTVPFSANQTRTVINEYQSPYGINTLPVHFFQYIVHTANTWKGDINSIRVEIDYSDLKPGTRFIVTPTAHKIRENKVLWYYTNIKPTPKLNPEISWEPDDAYQDGLTAIARDLQIPIHVRPNK